MGPVARAIWFIESRLTGDITLTDIASMAGVSRFHLARVFGAATGIAVMRYVRARRLTLAAYKLAGGTPDILSVALECGYGSHEAFTRAFRDHFGTTPDEVRDPRQLQCLQLTEALSMTNGSTVSLAEPRIVAAAGFKVAGLGERYTFETNQGITAQWQRFAPHIGHVPNQVGWVTYGVCCDLGDDCRFEYVAGVEVSGFDGLPAEFRRVQIPAQRYAVFTHRGHISGIRDTVYTIWNEWLPQSGYQNALSPDFERYDERFDSVSGNGDVEIWVPIG